MGGRGDATSGAEWVLAAVVQAESAERSHGEGQEHERD